MTRSALPCLSEKAFTPRILDLVQLINVFITLQVCGPKSIKILIDDWIFAEKYPAINNLLHKIRMKKRKDTLILAALISGCLIFLFLYVMH
jgi:hypothetical protein